MTVTPAPDGPRPPVALGCFLAAAVVVAVAGAITFAIVFLDSGADTGELQLDSAEAYAPGEVVFIGEENIFLVRLPSGGFIALRDLDSTNQNSPGARCRVALINIEDPSLGASIVALRARFSPEAAGATGVFRETCEGMIYDAAGARLTGDGANLPRHPVAVDSGGHVVVDLSERDCTVRTERAIFAPVSC